MNKRTIYIVDIEPLDNRYTKQWHYHIPRQLRKVLPNYNIEQISGDTKNYKTTSTGSFFDFNKTTDYKASQARKISQLFQDNKVKDDDIFFFTDAWNQTIHSLRYMSELGNIKIKTCGIWHAGWYDKTDILGKTIKLHDWVKPLELSMYNAYDLNFFATGHHVDTFKKEHSVDKGKALLCGYPLEYLSELIKPSFQEKQDIVIFPHRLNDDKAPYVFDILREMVNSQFPEILFVKTQEHNLSKDEYYKLLNKAKVVFSCNKHENLGISTYEGVCGGAVPVVPNKLSYMEMYPCSYRYNMNDSWYDDRSSWVQIAERIITEVKNYDRNRYNEVLNVAKHIRERYFTGDTMYHYIGRL